MNRSNTRSRHRFRGLLIALAITIGGGLLVASPAAAIWTTPLTATGSVSAGVISVTSETTVLNSTISNENYQTTHLVTVTNTQTSTDFTGTSSVTLTVLPSTTPVSGLGAALNAAVWQVGTTAACTASADPAANAVSGAWAAGVTSAPVAMARQQVAYFCVRGYPIGSSASASGDQNRQNVASLLGAPSGTSSFTPTFRADITLGSFTAAGSSTPPAIVTSVIYPFTLVPNPNTYAQVRPQNGPATKLCFDIFGGVGAPVGTRVDTFTCHTIGTDVTLGNQAISMQRVAGSNSVQLRARMTSPANGYLAATGVNAGAGVVVVAPNSADPRQLWIPQLVSSTGGDLLQLVNAASGLCINAPATAGTLTISPCANVTSEQTYWYPVALPFP
ncbi:RICIN domain-containing protein [Diaminobutyricibacter sp. McL0618]|uniref:RICIN domain-containing protein n=1 Tax=Leifsonia sp. McL0618 TaxID=3415677 RepID=UPI003CEBECC0